jgi:hypothetical protein
MRFSAFASPQGRRLIAEKPELLKRVIAELENIYGTQPFERPGS